MLFKTDVSEDIILYKVKSGDSLSAIIKKYHGNISLQQQKLILAKILSDNPEIKNPNTIYPGQVFILDIPQSYFAMPGYPKAPLVPADEQVAKALKQTLQKTTPQENNLLSTLAPIMLGTGSASMTMINQTFTSNTPLLTEMAENYNEYKADKLSKGQYDYRRKNLLSKLKMNLGATNILLNGQKLPNEVLRISRKKGSVPTHVITQKIGRMGRLSKIASRGGVVLSVAGLGVACHQIANTNNQQKKNEILVESLGGVIGGAGYGVVMTVLFVGTPIGWAAALAIGVGGVVASYGVATGVKSLYTAHGTNVDLASLTNINTLCQ